MAFQREPGRQTNSVHGPVAVVVDLQYDMEFVTVDETAAASQSMIRPPLR